MKTVLFIIGIIILLSGISTIAGILAYANVKEDIIPLPSQKAEKDANIKAAKISAIVLGISIVLYVLVSKFSKK